MPSTYEKIATTTLGSAAASIAFSGISGSYTDLVLISSLKMTTGTPETRVQFNTDTNTNYSYTIFSGSGTAASSNRASSTSGIDISYYGVPDTNLGNSVQITNIQNYSNTTTYKTIITRANNAGIGLDAIVGLWRSTTAITSITVYPNNSTFAIGSMCTLYGIKAA